MPQRIVAAAAAIPRTPPTEFCIWKLGKVPTTKGTFVFDDKSAADVLKEWRDWGNRLTFDYGHDATLGRGEDGKSAGSCNLELRDDGLWAVDVRWTDKAATELAAGEWLYFSPTFMSDPKTGRIKSLINIALTNVPATKNMAPLVAASQERPMTKEEAQKQLAAAERALGLVLVTLADDGDGDGDDEDMKKAKATAKAAAKAKLAKCKLEYESALRECAAFGDDDAPASSKGGGDDDNKPPPPKDKPDATARTAAAKKAVGASRIEQLAKELTGGGTEAEIAGKLAGLFAAQEQGGPVVARIEQLETKVFEQAADALMTKASQEGRLTPKAKAYAQKNIHDIDELTAYLETLPVVAATRTNGEAKKPDEQVASKMTIASLEQWEVEMCERMGTLPEDYLAQKKQNAERRTRGESAKPVTAARKSA